MLELEEAFVELKIMPEFTKQLFASKRYEIAASLGDATRDLVARAIRVHILLFGVFPGCYRLPIRTSHEQIPLFALGSANGLVLQQQIAAASSCSVTHVTFSSFR